MRKPSQMLAAVLLLLQVSHPLSLKRIFERGSTEPESVLPLALFGKADGRHAPTFGGMESGRIGKLIRFAESPEEIRGAVVDFVVHDG